MTIGLLMKSFLALGVTWSWMPTKSIEVILNSLMPVKTVTSTRWFNLLNIFNPYHYSAFRYTPEQGKLRFQTDTCTPKLIASFVTTAKRWKQTKRPLTGEWINSAWSNTYNGELSKHEGNSTPATTWMNLEDAILRKIRKERTNIVHPTPMRDLEWANC